MGIIGRLLSDVALQNSIKTGWLQILLLVRINENREIVGPYATCFRIDVEETEGNIASVEINKRLNLDEGKYDAV